jgi:hypothetical protein
MLPRLGKRERETRRGSESATMTVWIRLHGQPGVRDDRNTPRMTRKGVSLVLLIQVQALPNSGPQALIPANNLHKLLTLASGNMDPALAESPWPRPQFRISTNDRRQMI